MTRDELLNIYTVCGQPTKDGSVCDGAHLKESYPEWFALRAVVELHKPVADIDKTVCGQCASLIDPWDENCYPCPTIQAIEKELSND